MYKKYEAPVTLPYEAYRQFVLGKKINTWNSEFKMKTNGSEVYLRFNYDLCNSIRGCED